MGWIPAPDPADPDCPKCKGKGRWFDWVAYDKPENKHKGLSHFDHPCNCHAYANRQKIQDRCQHEYHCKKCGHVAPKPKGETILEYEL